jgi:DNA (cytosine-5)-methyltransferase 1
MLQHKANILPEISETYLECLEREFSQLGGSGKSVLGLFSGGGGLDLGFSAAGFDVGLSSDIVPEYCQTLEKNLPDHMATEIDVSDFDIKKIHNVFGSQGVQGIIGGPPCQSFSILGSRGATKDPRGALVFDYMQIIRQLQPEFFLFENVPGLKSVNGGQDWIDILRAFADVTGFKIYSTQINSVSFGVPQKRERVLIVGLRDHKADFSWPSATHAPDSYLGPEALLPAVTVAEAFQSLDGKPNHVKRIHGDRVSQRYAKIAPGSRDRIDHTDRIELGKPSGTVLVGSGGGGGRPFIHPVEHRHITVREAARLQSFPDWWEFSGGVTKQYRQVGNAVPPLMAKAVASQILKAISA